MQDKSKEGTAPTLQFTENLFAPEVYADEAAYFSLKGGNVCITFTSVRFDQASAPGQPHRVVIGRLVMPVRGAFGMTTGLYDYLKKNGISPEDSTHQAN